MVRSPGEIAFFAVHLAATLCLLTASVSSCFGEWKKTIDCPAGRVYRDLRKDAGREEFCERVLPGSLVVKDGPYRFWFSEGHPGSEGNYEDGRKVGMWKECDRFDRCTHTPNEAIFPLERERSSFKPEIPVWHAHGKYFFDFASCRSTQLTQRSGPDPIDLNIGSSRYRCEIAYTPESVFENGGSGGYFCRIPFAVGSREFLSLDLRRELPLAGLPQFCRPIYLRGEPLLIQDSKGALVVSTGDVEQADITEVKPGRGVLMLKLNKYAEDLLKPLAGQPGRLTTLLCFDPIIGPKLLAGTGGTVRFSFLIDTSPNQFKKLATCAANAFPRESGN